MKLYILNYCYQKFYYIYKTNNCNFKLIARSTSKSESIRFQLLPIMLETVWQLREGKRKIDNDGEIQYCRPQKSVIFLNCPKRTGAYDQSL